MIPINLLIVKTRVYPPHPKNKIKNINQALIFRNISSEIFMSVNLPTKSYKVTLKYHMLVQFRNWIDLKSNEIAQ